MEEADETTLLLQQPNSRKRVLVQQQQEKEESVLITDESGVVVGVKNSAKIQKIAESATMKSARENTKLVPQLTLQSTMVRRDLMVTTSSPESTPPRHHSPEASLQANTTETLKTSSQDTDLEDFELIELQRLKLDDKPRIITTTARPEARDDGFELVEPRGVEMAKKPNSGEHQDVASYNNKANEDIPTQPTKELPTEAVKNEGNEEEDKTSVCSSQEETNDGDDVVEPPIDEMEIDELEHPVHASTSHRRGSIKCTGCSLNQEPAVVWCCDCSQCLCQACDDKRHGSDALDYRSHPMASHRVEYIRDDVPLLTTIFELAIAIGAIAAIPLVLNYIGTNMVKVNYFFDSVCPTVERLRRLVFRLDHALFPLVRGQLGGWCDTEDAFVKIFSDLWVRGVVTGTDSFALMIMKLPSALSALVVILVVVPIALAIPFAAIATVLRLVETVFLPASWSLFQCPARLFRWAHWIVCIPWRLSIGITLGTAVGLAIDNEDYYAIEPTRQCVLPPKTGPRKRPTPSRGILDLSIFGVVSRVTRIFTYYRRIAHRAVTRTILALVLLAFAIRILLLCLPMFPDWVFAMQAGDNYEGLDEGETGAMVLFTKNPLTEDDPTILSSSSSSWWMFSFPSTHPDLTGEEGEIIRQMQESTESDFLEATLQRAFSSTYRKFRGYPTWMQSSALGVVLCLAFAGWIQYFLVLWDWKRRNRYRKRFQATQEQA